MIISVLFGLILTLVIIKKVGDIDKKTMSVQHHLVPALEKSTSNLALLKKVSDNFTFAILVEEEDMLSETSDAVMVVQNLKEITHNPYLKLSDRATYLDAFETYFHEATQYALARIQGNVDHKTELKMEIILAKYQELESKFIVLNDDIENEILATTDVIETISKEVIYFTIAYIIIFPFILFYISYVIYKDVTKRLGEINKSLETLGMKKNMIDDTDTIGTLSQKIDQAIEAYSIIDMQREELFKVNQKVQDSIDYAALMQKSILPNDDILNRYTKQNMICWEPRDTVGGDIYFVSELESKKEIIIMVIDGVGHGVSGAFLTILVKAIQTQIIGKINKGRLEPSPGKILAYFNRTIKEMLKQDKDSESNSGFDGGILYYNRETQACKYAGAKAPLYIVDGNKIEVIKPDRASVGFIRTDIHQVYIDVDLEIKKNTKYYMITDGMVDQQGSDNTHYGKKRFQKMILENHHKNFFEQRESMLQDFKFFKGDQHQSDDITVVGLQFI
jgi:serine phosphatase RsbU (regulator of sigma subunit)